MQPRACHWDCVSWQNFSDMKRTCITGSWRYCLSLEVVSSIPAGSTIICLCLWLCGFICVSQCHSVRIKPANVYLILYCTRCYKRIRIRIIICIPEQMMTSCRLDSWRQTMKSIIKHFNVAAIFLSSICLHIEAEAKCRHFADDIFKRIFLNGNPLKFHRSLFLIEGPVNNIPVLVQIMAWRRP